MYNNIKEVKALGLLILMFAIVALGLFFIPIILQRIPTVILVSAFLSYTIALIIVTQLNKKIKNRIVKVIYGIVFCPLDLLFTFLTITIPLGFIIIHVILYMGVSFLIPECTYRIVDFFFKGFITPQTHIYLVISLATFIMVILNYQLRNFVHRISPVRFKDSKKLKPYQIDKLSEYLLSESNIRFIVYGVYVIALISLNYANFQSLEGDPYQLGKPILQSFVTFIAFDRAIGIMKSLNFKPSDYLTMLFKSVLSKIKDLEDKNIL